MVLDRFKIRRRAKRAENFYNYFSSLQSIDQTTGAPKLINSDLFLEKRATVPIKTQGVQRSSSGKMSTF